MIKNKVFDNHHRLSPNYIAYGQTIISDKKNNDIYSMDNFNLI